MLSSGLVPQERESVSMTELVKIWTDIAMSEGVQRGANQSKDWNAERAIGIRAVLAAATGADGQMKRVEE
jgi:hypothetical protein